MTTEQKPSVHTPGPWELLIGHGAAKFYEGNYEILAACEGEHEANARLIAAAPDLLELCETVIDFLDNGTPIRPGCVLANDIREAIHKARGT